MRDLLQRLDEQTVNYVFRQKCQPCVRQSTGTEVPAPQIKTGFTSLRLNRCGAGLQPCTNRSGAGLRSEKQMQVRGFILQTRMWGRASALPEQIWAAL